MLIDDYEHIFINKIKEILNLYNQNNIKIFTTKFGYYISNSLKYILNKNNIASQIIYNIDYKDHVIHIILFSQKVKIFPKNYIIYQLEQKDISKWIDKKYELSIVNSIITFDYSQSNILKFHTFLQKKIVYYPIPLVQFNSIDIKPNNNILFFGSMNNIRKDKLNYLQKKLYPKYKIKIINGLYGEKLYKEILNSKIVLNIHFYKNAILETCRINEILSCNRIVISELPNMIDIDNYNLYKDKVIFVNNMDEMFNEIINKIT